MNLPKLKQLQYLIALRETLHFGRAAEQCHVTQSTLSAGLQELEGLLGVQLVERTRRTVLFTNLGEQVVVKARAVLAEAEGLVQLTMAAQRPLTGRVRMGVIPTIAPFLLPRALPPLRDRYPDLKLHLVEATSQELCDRLHAGTLDVVLYALPYRCGELQEEILFDDPFVVAFPPQAPMPEAPVRTADLEGRTLLLLEEGHCLRDHALAACSLPGVDPTRSILATSLHTVVQMVDNGLGATLLPQLAVDGGLLKGTGVQLAPLADEAPPRRIGLVWRKSNPRGAEFQLLADLLRALHPNAAKTAAM
ncbi:MAG: hydrogen peroxide-inducible genes activator [Rhodothalassiaceae bacterium]